jgi:hypothetical protein
MKSRTTHPYHIFISSNKQNILLLELQLTWKDKNKDVKIRNYINSKQRCQDLKLYINSLILTEYYAISVPLRLYPQKTSENARLSRWKFVNLTVQDTLGTENCMLSLTERCPNIPGRLPPTAVRTSSMTSRGQIWHILNITSSFSAKFSITSREIFWSLLTFHAN